jgi:hypothetical protein
LHTSLQSNFFSYRLGIDIKQRVDWAHSGDTGDDQYHSDPADGILQRIKHITYKQNSYNNPDDPVDLSDVVLEKIHDSLRELTDSPN